MDDDNKVDIKSRKTGKVVASWDKPSFYRFGSGRFNNLTIKGAQLETADLCGIHISNSLFKNTNFNIACFSYGLLDNTDFFNVSFVGANLRHTSIIDSQFINCDFTDASFEYAKFENFDRAREIFVNCKLPDFQVPQDEDLIVWKKLEYGVLAKLLIRKEWKRTASLINKKKCRAEAAEVLELYYKSDMQPLPHGYGHSSFDPSFMYVKGEVVRPTNEKYDPSIFKDCLPGIHFFLNIDDAKTWR